MNPKLLTIFILSITLMACTKQTPTTSPPSPSPTQAPQASLMPADRVEVVNFFGTNRCYACNTLGQLTKKTIETKFADQVESGQIIYLEINGQLPENQATVNKYQARGSSLYLNTVRGTKEEIQEEVTVWRLIGNETQFISYLESKLNTLLGN
jgi:hypothetical protein